MSNTPEGKVKDVVKAVLSAYKHELKATWPVPGGYGESMLDCVGHHRGAYFEIETKAPGKQPTPRQQHRIELLRATGAKVFVIGEKSVTTCDGITAYSGMDELVLWLKR